MTLYVVWQSSSNYSLFAKESACNICQSFEWVFVSKRQCSVWLSLSNAWFYSMLKEGWQSLVQQVQHLVLINYVLDLLATYSLMIIFFKKAHKSILLVLVHEQDAVQEYNTLWFTRTALNYSLAQQLFNLELGHDKWLWPTG